MAARPGTPPIRCDFTTSANVSRSDPRDWRRLAQRWPGGWLGSDGIWLLVGLCILCLAWARLALGDVSLLVFQDASEQTYAWWQYSVTEIQSGRLPLWDAYTFAGRTHV